MASMSEGDGQPSRAMDYEGLATKIVALLLLLEAVSVWFLWTYDTVGSAGETAFALFLAADLVSFAMISYTYRELKEKNRFGRLPLIAGCVFISALFLIALV
jgi:hypothetical protein